MPGRKSNVSTASNGPEEAPDAAPAKATKERDGLSVEDLCLPKSMIARLAKGVLPANTQIHKDALLALHKSATVFVSYIASGANENAVASGKKTIAPHDVIAALKDSELESFLPRLEAELKKYNETQCDKRNTYRRKVKEEKAAATDPNDKEGEAGGVSKDGEAKAPADAGANGPAGDDLERPAKKLKGDNGDAVLLDADEIEDDDAVDDQEGDDQGDDADEEEVVEDDVDDEEEDEDDDAQEDETMHDALEEPEDRSELRDEALDDPDSD